MTVGLEQVLDSVAVTSATFAAVAVSYTVSYSVLV